MSAVRHSVLLRHDGSPFLDAETPIFIASEKALDDFMEDFGKKFDFSNYVSWYLLSDKSQTTSEEDDAEFHALRAA